MIGLKMKEVLELMKHAVIRVCAIGSANVQSGETDLY